MHQTKPGRTYQQKQTRYNISTKPNQVEHINQNKPGRTYEPKQNNQVEHMSPTKPGRTYQPNQTRQKICTKPNQVEHISQTNPSTTYPPNQTRSNVGPPNRVWEYTVWEAVFVLVAWLVYVDFCAALSQKYVRLTFIPTFPPSSSLILFSCGGGGWGWGGSSSHCEKPQTLREHFCQNSTVIYLFWQNYHIGATVFDVKIATLKNCSIFCCGCIL